MLRYAARNDLGRPWVLASLQLATSMRLLCLECNGTSSNVAATSSCADVGMPAPPGRWPGNLASPWDLQKITAGALGMELAAVGVLGSTVVAWDYLSTKDDY